MRCPDCNEPMEKEDATPVEDTTSKFHFCVAVNYFCQVCSSYYRWEKGERLKLVA